MLMVKHPEFEVFTLHLGPGLVCCGLFSTRERHRTASTTKLKPACPSRTIEEEEKEALAQAMAEGVEDKVPDDGAIEIG